MIFWFSVLFPVVWIGFWVWMSWLIFTAPEFDDEEGWK